MKQAKVLSSSELNVVMAVIAQRKHATRNRLAVLLSHYAGFRVSEIASLNVSDVYKPDGSIHEQITLSAKNTKSKEARSVYISKKLKKELQSYWQHISNKKPDAPLLQTQKRTRFSGNTLCQLFGELYATASIKGASSHSGRRYFITQLANSAVSAKVIMTLVGHKNLSTTQRYIDVNDEMLKAAVEKI